MEGMPEQSPQNIKLLGLKGESNEMPPKWSLQHSSYAMTALQILVGKCY